jgi:formylglycine-generating enzyme required for sulfatase activity
MNMLNWNAQRSVASHQATPNGHNGKIPAACHELLRLRLSIRLLGCLLILTLAQQVLAQSSSLAQKKCTEFGFKIGTPQHTECVNQYLQSSGAGKAQSKPTQSIVPAITAAQREEKFWDEVKSAGNKEGYEAYLESYPKGTYAGLAKAHVVRLADVTKERQQAVSEAERKLEAERAAFEVEQKHARERAIATLQAAADAMQKLATERAAFETEQKHVRERVAAEAAQKVASAEAARRAAATPRTGQMIKDCADCPEMVVIPGGSFVMGADRNNDEKPPHPVTLRSFLMGKTEVTQGQWKAVMGSNPSRFSQCGDDCPVEQVSWNAAQDFIRKLNQKTGLAYRLPSEAEWEYSARAGSTTEWGHGNDEFRLADFAWFSINSGAKSQAVAQKRPNSFGLHDMHGNVWEWVEDCWHDNYSGAPAEGSAWTTTCSSAARVLRGGTWYDDPMYLRSAYRNWETSDNRDNFIGLRLARTP